MNLELLTASRPWLVAGWTMLHFFWVGSLIGLAFALGKRMLRKTRPEIRYGVACLGLATMAVAPIVIASFLVVASRPKAPGRNDSSLLTSEFIEFAEIANPMEPPRPSEEPRTVSPPLRNPGRPTSPIAPQQILGATARGLPGLWLVGAPATFILLATGLIGTERLRRRSRPLTGGEIPEQCRRLAATLGIVRPVALGVCDHLVTPLLLGVVRPMILLPTAALTGWSPEQVEMALLHELAHVRRFDNLVNLAQRTVEALLFFHPAVWWLSAWVRLEREHCCDRVVIAHTGHPRPYAELLAALAMPGVSPGRTAVAMAEAPIVARIRRILNLEDHSMPLSRTFVALVASLLIAPAALVTSQAGPPDPKQEKPPAPAAPAKPDPALTARLEPIFRRALHDAEMFNDMQGRANALAQIAGAQERAGDRDGARRTYAKAVAIAVTVSLDDALYSPHILLWVARRQAKSGFRDEAVDSLRKLLRIVEAPVSKDHDKSSLFSSLVETQAELGDKEGIRETIRAARHFYTTTNDAGTRLYAPRSLVALQAKAGDLAGAFRMIHDPDLFQGEDAANMRRKALISAVWQIKAGDEETARPILEEAVQAVKTFKDEIPWRGLRTRNEDLRIIAKAEARLGRFAEATKRAQEIEAENAPEPIAESARMELLDPEKFNKTDAFAFIGKEQAKAGDQDGARESADKIIQIVNALQADNYRWEPLLSAVEIRSTLGDFAEALRIAELMNPDKRGEHYITIATAQQRANDKAGARETLERAQRHLESRIDAVKPDSAEDLLRTRDFLIRDLARIQALQADLKGAIETIKRSHDSEIENRSLQLVVWDRAATNDLDGVMEIVNQIGSPKLEAKTLEMALTNFLRSVPFGE